MRTIAKAITDAKQNQMLTVLHMFDLQLIFKTDSDDVFSYLINSYSSSSYTCKTDVSIYVVISTSDFDEEMSIDTITVDGPHLSLYGRGVRGGADAISKRAWCEVPRRCASGPQMRELLDILILFLATRSGRVPLHASAIVLDGTAIVLAGRSGAGKSTLALAAARAGLALLTDDTVYIQTSPRLTLWGLKRPLHVFASDAPFAEGPLRLRAGRWKKAVEVPRHVGRAQRAILCVLDRGEDVTLSPVAADDATAVLTAALEPGFDHFRAELPAALGALAADGAWRLTLSDDPAEAVALLRRTFADGRRAAG